jgi:hypothetical protein
MNRSSVNKVMMGFTDPLVDSDLGRGEPGAVGGSHGRHQVIDEFLGDGIGQRGEINGPRRLA